MKMNEFIKFFDKVTECYPMHLEIYYSKITDWSIRVYKKGCGKKYGSDLEILYIQDCDVDLVFAKAQVELKEWLSDNEGGY